jgi:uncharacterized protein
MMLLLLSPAKKLDYDSPLPTRLASDPLFVERARGLIEVLKQKSVAEVAKLMTLSETLAELNVQRYADWKPEFTRDNARAAVLAFNGDVYEGLQAPTLSEADLQWAQEHVLILSGLYGALRPLDLMQPYRLEMGTKLPNPSGANLYAYWKDTIAPYINERLNADSARVVVNLASDEYFKSVDQKVLNALVIQCVFQDQKADAWKVISFYAKRARGLMARFVIQNRIHEPERLLQFNAEGYTYAPQVSSENMLVFRRPEN